MYKMTELNIKTLLVNYVYNANTSFYEANKSTEIYPFVLLDNGINYKVTFMGEVVFDSNYDLHDCSDSEYAKTLNKLIKENIKYILDQLNNKEWDI